VTSYFILLIVPQTGPWPSLEEAAKRGEIATIPVLEIISAEYPQVCMRLC
jgi:hypothetical protein